MKSLRNASVDPREAGGIFDCEVKASIGKVPVLVIVGVITLVAFVYALYAGLTTPAIGGPISPRSFIFGLLIPFAFPVVLYYASRRYQRSRGVDIDLAFKEVPPE